MLNKKGFALMESILLLEVVAIIVILLFQNVQFFHKEFHFEKNVKEEVTLMKDAYEK